MNNHDAVIKGIIPPYTRQEKGALIQHLKGQLKVAVEALEFYGDFISNTNDDDVYGETGDLFGNECWDHDEGRKAREALAKIRGKGNE